MLRRKVYEEEEQDDGEEERLRGEERGVLEKQDSRI